MNIIIRTLIFTVGLVYIGEWDILIVRGNSCQYCQMYKYNPYCISMKNRYPRRIRNIITNNIKLCI